MLTVLLLIGSNTFMNLAWYGHLKFQSAPLLLAILASWLIALPEYSLQVPANRYGHMADGGDGTTQQPVQQHLVVGLECAATEDSARDHHHQRVRGG